MRAAWQPFPYPILAVSIHFGQREANAVGGNAQGDTPGINDHGFSIAVTDTAVMTKLAGGDHVHLVFNGACSEQREPMILSRLQCERSGAQKYVRTLNGQLSIQLRESQVVTDRQANVAKLCFDQTGLVTAHDVVGFFERDGARNVDVEEMKLPVGA